MCHHLRDLALWLFQELVWLESLAICLDSRVLQPYWFVDENLSFPSNNFLRKTNAISKKVFRVMVLKIEECLRKNCEFFSRRLSESKSCNCVLLRFLGHLSLSHVCHKLKNYQVLRLKRPKIVGLHPTLGWICLSRFTVTVATAVGTRLLAYYHHYQRNHFNKIIGIYIYIYTCVQHVSRRSSWLHALFHAEIKQSNTIRALKTADHQAVSKVFF